jgi:hypothetical protein
MLQDNNLMLLDVDGFPRTIDTAADSIGIGVDTAFSQDLAVGGNLTVNGDIISGGTMDVVVSDNFIDLSNGQLTGSNKAGGLTVNVQATVARVPMTIADGAVNDVIFSGTDTIDFGVGGYDPAAAGVAAGDIIEIAGAADLAGNNGLFVVDSVTPTSITIKGAVQIQSPWAQTAFENGTLTAAGATLAPGVDLGVFCIADGQLLDAGGNPILPVGQFVSSFTVAAKISTIVYEAAANVSLQEAYNVGQEIQITNAKGDLVVHTDDVNANDFIVRKGVRWEYTLIADMYAAVYTAANEGAIAQVGPGAPYQYFLLIDAANSGIAAGWALQAAPTNYLSTGVGLLTLGSSSSNRLNLSGEVSSDITFETGPGASTKMIINDEGVVALGGTSAYLQATGNAVGAVAGIMSSGHNSAPIGYTSGYYDVAVNPSVIGDLTGTIIDGDGNSTAFTISIGIAAGADPAAVVANTTSSPTAASGNPTVILVDGGFGDFVFEGVNAAGIKSTFSITGESIAGVYAGLDDGGQTVPWQSSYGAAALSIESAGNNGFTFVGDMLIEAYRNLEIVADSTTITTTNPMVLNSGDDLSATASGLMLLTGGAGVSINGVADEVDITTSAALDLNFGDMSANGDTIELIAVNSVSVGGGEIFAISDISTYISAMGTNPGDRAEFSGAGVGSQSILTANAPYASGASIGGDLTGTLYDVDGATSALSITFLAGELTLNDLIAGATVTPAGVVSLSDDGFGKLKITSAAFGARVSFLFTGENNVGVGTSLGFTSGNPTAINPYSASNGEAPVRIFAGATNIGDVEVDAQRHLDLFSMKGSIELKTQTAGQNITINAQEGSLAISGDSSSSVSVAGADQTLTVEVTGGGTLQKLHLDSGGTADDSISLASAFGGVKTAAARASIITTGGAGVKAIDLDSSAQATSNIELKSGADGWVGLRSYTWLSTSAGWIAPVGVNVTAGEPLLVADAAGTSSFVPADAASGTVASAQVIGIATEAVLAGVDCRACTIPGTLVQTALAGAQATDPGKPVYLAAAVAGAGKLTLTAPTATGNVVYRVGWCHSVVGGLIKMSFAPQFIALRP